MTTRNPRPSIRNCKQDPVTFLAAEPISRTSRRFLERCLRQYGPVIIDGDSIRVDDIRSLSHRLRLVAHLRRLCASLGVESRLPLRSTVIARTASSR